MDWQDRIAEILGGISVLVLLGYGGWIAIARYIERLGRRRSTKTSRMRTIHDSRIPREPWNR